MSDVTITVPVEAAQAVRELILGTIMDEMNLYNDDDRDYSRKILEVAQHLREELGTHRSCYPEGEVEALRKIDAITAERWAAPVCPGLI